MVCRFMYNNDDVFVVFSLDVLFLFVISKNGGGFSTFRVGCLSVRSECRWCFGPTRVTSIWS